MEPGSSLETTILGTASMIAKFRKSDKIFFTSLGEGAIMVSDSVTY